MNGTFDSIVVDFFKTGFNGAVPSYISLSILICLSIIVSVILSGFIGAQRERNGHPAGFRTHILISLGSTVLMIISLYGADGTDKMRLAAAGVTGIGFLGAGSIIQNGFSVKGLTTAASIWVTMAIGMCCGTGYFILASGVTLVCLLSLTVFQKIEFAANGKSAFILVVTELDKSPTEKIIKICDDLGVDLKDIDTTLVKQGSKTYVRLTFKVANDKKGFVLPLLEEINKEIEPIESKILH